MGSNSQSWCMLSLGRAYVQISKILIEYLIRIIFIITPYKKDHCTKKLEGSLVIHDVTQCVANPLKVRSHGNSTASISSKFSNFFRRAQHAGSPGITQRLCSGIVTIGRHSVRCVGARAFPTQRAGGGQSRITHAHISSAAGVDACACVALPPTHCLACAPRLSDTQVSGPPRSHPKR